eukprot:2632454-Alexandrium_andersonii.AAC.1
MHVVEEPRALLGRQARFAGIRSVVLPGVVLVLRPLDDELPAPGPLSVRLDLGLRGHHEDLPDRGDLALEDELADLLGVEDVLELADAARDVEVAEDRVDVRLEVHVDDLARPRAWPA